LKMNNSKMWFKMNHQKSIFKRRKSASKGRKMKLSRNKNKLNSLCTSLRLEINKKKIKMFKINSF
jgi:hypothetical protein